MFRGLLIGPRLPWTFVGGCHEVCRLPRLVYTSTIDVLGHDPSRAEITEETGFFNFTGMGYFYGESKFEAEYRLRRFADQHDLDVVIIYPGMMLGPYGGTHQWGGLLMALRDGSLPGAPAGGSSFCHVTEVARAHLAALDKGRRGHGYICAGHNMPYRDCLDLMADAIGAAHPRVTLPEWAYVAIGRAEELRAAVTGRPPLVDPGMAHYLSKYQYVDSAKAIAALGYAIPDFDQTLTDTVDWYRSQGHDL